jgi:hypothetical protein
MQEALYNLGVQVSKMIQGKNKSWHFAHK